MGEVRQPDKVKLIVGLIYADEPALTESMRTLATQYGRTDLETKSIRFTPTTYYNDEMGCDLWRRFISFENLIDPSELPSIKLFTNELEAKLSIAHGLTMKRRINIDPGYLELSKLILASTKNFSHRIHVSDGIYAEVTMMYRDGTFVELEWTYPEYKGDFAREFFAEARLLYQRQLRDPV